MNKTFRLLLLRVFLEEIPNRKLIHDNIIIKLKIINFLNFFSFDYPSVLRHFDIPEDARNCQQNFRRRTVFHQKTGGTLIVAGMAISRGLHLVSRVEPAAAAAEHRRAQAPGVGD